MPDTPPPHDRFVTWPAARNLPVGPVIDVFFVGLLDFCYKPETDRGVCEVGFLRADGRHQPKVEIFEDDAPYKTIANFTRVTFELRNNGNAEQANALFLKDGTDPNQDFRWVIDLDAPPFYPEDYDKNGGVFTAKLVVQQGVFFSAHRTKYPINRVTRLPVEVPGVGGVNAASLDHPADIIGTKIPIGANEYLSVIVDGVEVAKLPVNPLKKYEIKVSNICIKENGKICDGFVPAD